MANTLFLSVSDVRHLISKVGLRRFYIDLADQLTADFKRWPEFEKSSRLASYSENGVIELMPVSDSARFSFKYVNGHPNNIPLGLPTVMAFGCLAEVDTGFPVLLSEMTVLTALRTAATSAVAARALAKPQPAVMALIGCGAQAEFQILAFHTILGVNEFHLVDLDAAATARLVKNLTAHEGLKLEISAGVEEALVDADIVTTATAAKKHQQVLNLEMIRPGMHINAIGGDCPGKTELDPEILKRSEVFVEYTPQTRIEGEIQQMSPDFEVTEIWEVLTGKRPGRTTIIDVTVFDSVGFSMEDYSILNLIYSLARKESIGQEIELIPEMHDAKDLISSLLTK